MISLPAEWVKEFEFRSRTLSRVDVCRSVDRGRSELSKGKGRKEKKITIKERKENENLWVYGLNCSSC